MRCSVTEDDRLWVPVYQQVLMGCGVSGGGGDDDEGPVAAAAAGLALPTLEQWTADEDICAALCNLAMFSNKMGCDGCSSLAAW